MFGRCYFIALTAAVFNLVESCVRVVAGKTNLIRFFNHLNFRKFIFTRCVNVSTIYTSTFAFSHNLTFVTELSIISAKVYSLQVSPAIKYR